MNSPSKMSVRSFFTQVEGLLMHALELGEDGGGTAPTFVLVPGLGLSGRYMMPTAELLAPVGKVWVPDLPGFGASGKPTPCLDIPELADSLAAWMAANRIARPVMIGNSLGAQVIVDFATRYPERLDRAVLVSLTIDPEARQVSSQVWRLLVDALHEPAEMYWIAVTDYLRAGLRRVLQTLRHALADPVARKLPQLACPMLVIRGGRDPIVPQRWAERTVRLIGDGELVIFPRAAHAVNFNSPEALNAEVRRFAGKGRTILQDPANFPAARG